MAGLLNFKLTLEDLLGPKLAALAAKVEQFGREVEKPHEVKVNTKKAEGGLGGLGALAGKAFAAIAIFDTAKGIVNMGSHLEQTRVQFETFTGSAEKGNAAIAELQKFAQITPFDDEQVISAGRSLLAFGEDANNLTPLLTKLGNISSATGKDLNELTSLYGKNKLSGIIQGEDLNQLTEAGIPVMDSLARQLHVTTDQVKKMGAEGKISFHMLDVAFDELGGAGGKWGDLMDKQSKTFSGRLSSLVGFAQNIGGKMGEALTPGLGKIVDAGASLLTWAQSKQAQIIEMFRPLQDALQPLIDAVAQVYEQLGITSDGAGFLTAIFNGLSTVINYLSPVIKIAATGLAAVYLRIAHLIEVVAKFVATSPRLQKFFSGLWESAKAVFEHIVQGAVKAFDGVADILEGVFTLDFGKVKQGLGKSLEALADNNIITIAQKAGSAFGDGYSKGFEKSTLFDVAAGEGPAATSGPAALMKGKKPGPALAPGLTDKAGTAGANGGSKVNNFTLHINTLRTDVTVQAASITESAEQIGQIVLQKLFSSFNDLNTLSSVN